MGVLVFMNIEFEMRGNPFGAKAPSYNVERYLEWCRPEIA